MKIAYNVTIAIVIILGFSGCGTWCDLSIGYIPEWRHRVEILTTNDFPLPEKTEFDPTNTLRQAYFKGYAHGVEYAKHILGYGPLYQFAYETPEQFARICGWKDGRYAAARKIDEIRKEVEAETLRAYSNKNQTACFAGGRLLYLCCYQIVGGSNVPARITSWYENGRKESDCRFDSEGRFTKQRRVWYSNGLLQETETWRRGELEGVCYGYYPNGQRKYVLRYTNSIPAGMARVWNDQGRLIATETFQDEGFRETIYVPGYLITGVNAGFEVNIDPAGPIAQSYWNFLNRTERETNAIVAIKKDDDGMLWVRTGITPTNGVLYLLNDKGRDPMIDAKGKWNNDTCSITNYHP